MSVIITNDIACTAQVALDKIYECSKRVCRSFPYLASRIQKATFMNCMKDIKGLTDRLFGSDGKCFIEVLYELGELERMIVALEKHVPTEKLDVDIHDSSLCGAGSLMFQNATSLISAADVSDHGELVASLQGQLSHTIFSVKEWELKYEVQAQLWKEKEQMSAMLQKSSDQFT
jgi:hypothetical protein